ncbi:aspartate kinase [Amylolactobacillus amylotrophicus DSM 20534]|uniref:Aspartate kinase n=3 Tax=Amylolactobacillus TaxID=2767876 RepID=A0A1L6XBT8_9LACO|nr:MULTISPECIES: aspartate kinase [Amylolactobacillus]APT18443.1 aspartate kinase [Amylolactobacillus amylophilus DSM 20533 = JCM 1125]KRK38230.1 aspartate kinase [Amylolactobacillus amylotrophicus DSM 20534]KRM43128.1 aspartate kinase [Amylolactobacillus amylophilus DSM 20533 = JCM 1125]GED80472.1 aspartokinase [Amylolactobacillus amylophilus]
MKITKFGGTSLADASQYRKVIDIISADAERQVIVTSAPGKRFPGDIKVTDLLIQYAQLTLAGAETAELADTIYERYETIGRAFQVEQAVLEDIHTIILDLVSITFHDSAELQHTFKAHGEILNALLFASCLNSVGIPARFVDPRELGIVAQERDHEVVLADETYRHLNQFNLGAQRIVVPGFYAYTPDNKIITFARGGSDITGSILAAGLHATMYENFTDVDAIFAANPQIIDNPAAIKLMTYREMRELSYAGFSVFNDEAIIPAIQGHIPINVKNTNHPDAPGTLIVSDSEYEARQLVTGIAASSRFAALYLHRYLLNKQAGFTLKILQILYKYGVSYEHMPSGIDDLTIIFDKSQLQPEIISHFLAEIKEEVCPDEMEWIDDYAIIMVVGEGMRNRVGIIENIINPLALHDIPVKMINQGASRISIMLGTDRADAANAIKYIYNRFFNNNYLEV